MYRHPFLSDAQREAIESAHFDLDEREIARYWTLSDQDLLRIDRRRRDSTASDSLFNSASFVFPAGHRKGETAFLYRSCSMSASNCEFRPTISKLESCLVAWVFHSLLKFRAPPGTQPHLPIVQWFQGPPNA